MLLKSRPVGNIYAMNTSMKIAIIGNGIAAWCINKYLLNHSKGLIVHRYGDDDYIRSCSFRTTSINCMRGTKKGISPLGDLMVDSMDEFIDYYNTFNPNGVYKTHEYQLWDSSNDKMTKRFGKFAVSSEVEGIKLKREMNIFKSEAYLIDPNKFYQSLELPDIKGKFVSNLESIDGGFEITCDNQKNIYDRAFLCSSNFNKLFIDHFKNNDAIDFVKRTKPVKGDYLFLETSHNYSSMSIAINNHHLIFRPNQILIGSTSFNDCDIQSIVTTDLEKVYENVKDSVDIQLPVYSSFQKICGVRSKGRKRTPFWGEVAPNLYMIGGLYKNGFSFSFLAAKQLSESFLK